MAALVLVALVACGAGATSRPTRTRSGAAAGGPSAIGVPPPDAEPAFLPPADARLPASPRRFAPALDRVTHAVRASVQAWISDGGTDRWPPPKALVLQTLYQQRLYRVLARRPALARATLRRLPASVRPEAEAIVRATAEVFAHANPVPPSYPIRTRAPLPAETLLRAYRDGQRRFGVPWQVLAAVNYVETKFGRVVSQSSAGARGPMQFLPSTWRAYGLGGDIHDPHDAILGAANYLHASGAPGDIRGALYRYNPVPEYVDAVATYAAAIRRDPRLYYAMYCWQVFVLTTRGDRRVTGPGL